MNRPQVLPLLLIGVLFVLHPAVLSAATPIAHWDFSDLTNKGKDSAGSNHLTLASQAVVLSGTGPNGLNVLSMTNSATLGIASRSPASGLVIPEGGKLSIAMWINYNVASAQFARVISFVSADSTNAYAIALENGNTNQTKLNLRATYNGTLDQTQSSSALLSVNTWTHMAMTFDASTHKLELYIDAVKITSFTLTTGTIASTADTFFIGKGTDTQSFAGMVADVRLYDGILTSQEVSSLQTVPEPSSVAFVLCAGLGLLFHLRRAL